MSEQEQAKPASEAVEDGKQDLPAEEELDEDGLKIQRYLSTVLIVVPDEDYAEETLRYARSTLYNVHVGSRMVSLQDSELIHGRFQDEFIPDGLIRNETLEPYAGVIFVGGGGAAKLADDPDAQRLAREAAQAGKLIGAWDRAVEILARAGVVRGKRVTGAPSVEKAVRSAGGRYTGRQLEVHEKLVTARDDAVGMRFGKALAAVVSI